MNQKALAVISFGTTYTLAQDAIMQIESTLSCHAKEYDCFRAFTSRMVIAKLKREQGQYVLTPEELMEQLYQKGYKEVLCQPLHIINGFEFEKMYKALSAFTDKFDKIQIGRPLLTFEDDYKACCDIVMKYAPAPKEETALVFMGHGTAHYANASYCQLENTFRALGHEHVYVGTVEGFPNLDYIIGRLKKHNITRVHLMPFMIVAGDHAQNDMAGEEPDSWKSILESEGFQVTVQLDGLALSRRRDNCLLPIWTKRKPFQKTISYCKQELSGKLGENPAQVRYRNSRITDLLLVFYGTEMQGKA